MRRVAGAFALALVLAASPAARAVQPDEILPDPALEARARSISAGLRCVVCQNQSIDDSDAPLARDLRLLVRERLREGDSDGAVRSFVSSRYGEFVLLRPVWAPHTALLWLGPILILLAAGAGVAVALRRRQRTVDQPLSEAERSRIEALGITPRSP